MTMKSRNSVQGSAVEIIQGLAASAPGLVEQRDRLKRVLSDGSIAPDQYAPLRSVEQALDHLLSALSYASRPAEGTIRRVA